MERLAAPGSRHEEMHPASNWPASMVSGIVLSVALPLGVWLVAGIVAG